MAVTCPECRSERLAWELRRRGARGLAHSIREIVWTCRGCGATWTEPISEAGVHNTPAASDDAPDNAG